MFTEEELKQIEDMFGSEYAEKIRRLQTNV